MKMVTVLILAAIAFGFAPATASTFTVDIQNFAFIPAGRHIVVGDAIRWINQDAVLHTSTSDNGVWDSGNLSQGQSFLHTFSSAGTFPYHCAVHTFMRDTIFVSPETGADDPQPEAPKDFELEQNYPNPFNGQTLIMYVIPEAAYVTVDIYDILGQRISSLADGPQSAGPHEYSWNAPNQASGIFFYRVSVDGQTKTGRMVLLK